MNLPVSQNSRDARIESLWNKLDLQNKGELDINGLKRGLKKLDHPLKNAQGMLEDVVKAMDKNGDKVIQYEGKNPTACYGNHPEHVAHGIRTKPSILQNFAHSSSRLKRSFLLYLIPLIEIGMVN